MKERGPTNFLINWKNKVQFWLLFSQFSTFQTNLGSWLFDQFYQEICNFSKKNVVKYCNFYNQAQNSEWVPRSEGGGLQTYFRGDPPHPWIHACMVVTFVFDKGQSRIWGKRCSEQPRPRPLEVYSRGFTWNQARNEMSAKKSCSWQNHSDEHKQTQQMSWVGHPGVFCALLRKWLKIWILFKFKISEVEPT